MNRAARLLLWCFAAGLAASFPLAAHDVITTKITWNREIIRIINARCASCHHPDGPAFSLMTYDQGRPWAKAIQEEVLERRMPPWGAVKGFGEFRDDPALTPEQLEVIGNWVDGGAPEGEARDLPPPPKLEGPEAMPDLGNGIAVTGEFKLSKQLILDGLLPKKIAANQSFQITAELPDGQIEPLLWLLPYKPAYSHVFHLRNALHLPVGTVIHGVPEGASVLLLPAGPEAARAAASHPENLH